MRYRVNFGDEFRQIKCGIRIVTVELTDDKAVIQVRKGSPKVHTSRQRFFSLNPTRIMKESEDEK